MIRSFLACAGLAAASAIAAPITLSIDSDGDPIVRYTFDAGQSDVRFADAEERTYSEVRNASWKFDEKCFSLTQVSIVRSRPECGDLVVKLTWDGVIRDRMYPAIVRLRSGGVLLFAGYIEGLTADRERLEEIRAVAPPGGVAAFRGDKTVTALLLPSSTFDGNSAGWIYLGPDHFIDGPAGLLLADDGIPAALSEQLASTVPKVMKVYSERMGALREGRASIYVTWSQRDKVTRSWQADAVPGSVMRFGLSGSMWAEPDENTSRLFVEAIAHEVAHFWDANHFAEAQGAAPWVSEGGAELLAVTALYDIGAFDAKTLQARIDRAIGECAGVVGSNAWSQVRVRQFGRAPYACGLAIQLAIVAHARRLDKSMDPLAFWRQFGSESAPYLEGSMALYLFRHGDADGSIQLTRMLTDTTEPFMVALKAFYLTGDVELVKGSPASDGMRRTAGSAAFAAVMGAACDGNYGLTNRGDHFEVDARIGCKTFTGGMKVTAIEGRNLFTDAAGAVAAIRGRCASPGATVHVSRTEGDDIPVTCDESVLRNIPDLDALFSLAPGEASRLITQAR